MTYDLHRGDGPPRPFATLADALEASGVPPCCWNAAVPGRPDEIATFYAEPGIVPGGGAQWTIRAPGAAAGFCAAERMAGRLP